MSTPSNLAQITQDNDEPLSNTVLIENSAREASDQKLSPMLTSYREYKARYADSLLLFQVGDFYETFFEDAVTISKALNLTLTSRDKNSPHPIPMAGVPLAVVDGYVERLINQGYSVALVSQTEAPANGKGMFGRRLERIVTPGVRILNSQESRTQETFLCAVALDEEDDGAIAYTDVQTGVVTVRERVTRLSLAEELLKLSPSEVVLPNSQRMSLRLPMRQGLSLKYRVENSDLHSSRVLSDIAGYTRLSPIAKRAAKMLLAYLDETTVEALVTVSEIRVAEETARMSIDSRTRANLELLRNQRDGGAANTLFSVLDRTVTPGGARLLSHWIGAPLMSVDEINARLAAVRVFKNSGEVRRMLRESLQRISDIERIAARIELAIAAPRELGALRDSLAALPELAEILNTGAGRKDAAPLLHGLVKSLVVPKALDQLCAGALVESPPLSSHEGGIFADGWNAEIDHLRSIKNSGSGWIAELEERERKASGISSLKIRFNNVIGYYFEVTKTHLAKVPAHFIRKQSMVAGERFTSDELRRHEEEVLGADTKLCMLERRLFEEFRIALKAHTAALRVLASAASEIDVLASLAEVAEREDFVEPKIVDGDELIITHGRHPVLAQLLRSTFVPNTLTFSAKGARAALITGPNMGGKSTYLRQAALIVIMAQLGSFVPAEAATIGVVDKIFARIGASDNMMEGESTFMVEMREASHIISHATPRSLLLIDELGRGTATADGLALARAILEWIISEIGCRILFATHFHELTTLDAQYPQLINLSVAALEQDGDVIFTHHITPGPASRSYGIDVAKLAGLPRNLIERARGELGQSKSVQPTSASTQLAFFTAKDRIVEPPDYGKLRGLKRRLAELQPDSINARDALALLWDLHDEAKKSE